MFLYTNNELLERESEETILFTIGIKKKKIHRNTFNQGGKKPVHWKLGHWCKKSKNIQINEKIVYAYGLE